MCGPLVGTPHAFCDSKTHWEHPQFSTALKTALHTSLYKTTTKHSFALTSLAEQAGILETASCVETMALATSEGSGALSLILTAAGGRTHWRRPSGSSFVFSPTEVCVHTRSGQGNFG